MPSLTVATRHVPPFAIRNADGSWEGVSIELWQAIAGDLGIEFRIRELGLQDMLDGVRSGEVDLAVAALTITSAREQELDFRAAAYSFGVVEVDFPAEAPPEVVFKVYEGSGDLMAQAGG